MKSRSKHTDHRRPESFEVSMPRPVARACKHLSQVFTVVVLPNTAGCVICCRRNADVRYHVRLRTICEVLSTTERLYGGISLADGQFTRLGTSSSLWFQSLSPPSSPNPPPLLTNSHNSYTKIVEKVGFGATSPGALQC